MNATLSPIHRLVLDTDRKAFVDADDNIVISFEGRTTYCYGTRVEDGVEVCVSNRAYLVAMNRAYGRTK